MARKGEKRIGKGLIAVIMCLLSLTAPLLPAAQPVRAQDAPAEHYSAPDIAKVIEGIINWKKADNGSTPEGYLINDTFLTLAGTTSGDWFPFGLGRYGYPDNDQGYLAMITEVVQNRYQEPGKLSAVKATEWHRISLAILAMGGDPTAVGKDQNGKPINLIADGTYNRGQTASLGRQGINGWIWGLIALDSKRYAIPAGASYSRSDIIREILSRQLADGGFTLTGNSADPDITAMALQALAPYYGSTQTYTYQSEATGERTTRSVREAADEALAWLAKAQLPEGDYESWGTRNLESTAQVAVALCSLGIDPQKDQRFIKNGHSLLAAMLSYRMPDGGFVHSRAYDPDNPTSQPDKSNSMASEQALYSLVAVWRQMKGLSSLYDFRPAGDTLAGTPDSTGESRPKLIFSSADRASVEALPAKLTTGQYVEVVSLLNKLEQSGDFPGKADYAARLAAARQAILGIQAKIDGINQDVLHKLYPFEGISLADRGVVNDIVQRYETLSDYDQGKILRWDDVVKTKTKLDNLLRALYIALALAVTATAATIGVTYRIKRRRGKKAREMEELAALYGEKDSP
ncbi:terpene cyclase/mutase family protein [Desulfosporosinus sp. PR]|uniref:prenyltransferase/squalene oxidase repeat-containing protein n=1 Tax=Candidatus Desulfosporosinus nitrosoreducens TaxID=3401928 RepID=UPI0027F0AD20|nr:terpene cyclase/mutase family protein [Desulfosporosinus sp. PR]MDQ7094894.1 terpene cyclase/mutase family protein [Desulfosporosinus sp. PR]